MKKRTLMTLMAVVLSLVIAVSGTIAYLQDTDSDVNVMTLGNVYIEQIEQERDNSGELVSFKQGKPAYPAVYEGSSIPYADASQWPVADDPAWKVVEDNENVIDKFITVKNTGKSDAYVRTIIAFEVGQDAVNDEYMHLVCNGNDEVAYEWIQENGEDVVVEIAGGYYKLCVFTYAQPLPAGETTIPSVKQIYLDKTATNEVCEAYGETFEILAVSQAVQAEGFSDAKVALDTAFGVVSAQSHPWIDMDDPENENDQDPDGMKMPIFVHNVEEMAAVCATGGHMIMANDITYSAENTEMMIGGSIFLINGKNVTLDLNGYTFAVEEDAKNINGAIFFVGNPGGHINILGDGNIDVKNELATIVWTLQSGTANIYGGSYTSNSVSHEAMFYSQGNGGVINIYGGKYTYELDRHLNGGFNVSDQAGGNLRIVLHEGVLLSCPEYSQHLQGTTNGEQNRIQLAAGCTLEETVIDGTTWYKVVKQ